MRISIDTKATVHVGEYSRGGRSRGLKPVEAWDHDMRTKEKLVPGSILESVTGKAFLFFTGSYKTSDFLVDRLLLWWNERKQDLFNVKHLLINMDNGPECSGRRSQFLLRMVEFADMSRLTIRLIYYPPYHTCYKAAGWTFLGYTRGFAKSSRGYIQHNQPKMVFVSPLVWRMTTAKKMAGRFLR